MRAVKPRRSHGLLAILILLCSMVGGCLGNGQGEAPAPNEALDAKPVEPPAVEEDPDPPSWAPLRFKLEQPMDHVYWYNGSFSATDTGLVGGFVTGAFVQHVDLTAVIPPHVPTRIDISVTLDAAHIPVVGPTARADPEDNQTVWYDQYWRNPSAGRFEFGGTFKRAEAGTFGVALEAYTPGPADPAETHYVVQVNVTAEPDGVPVGVPTALTLDGNETIRFQTEQGNQAELLVYGPDDRLLDRRFFVGAERWTVPPHAGGELVVVPILGATDLRILHDTSTNRSIGGLRALDLERDRGAPHELETLEVTTWDFEVEPRPLRVLVTVVGSAGAPWTCVGSLGVELRAPEATLLEGTSDCPSPTNAPFLYEERYTWASHVGDARLAPGTYSVAVDNSFWSGHEAYHTVEWYAR